jgi:hypothetical protein
VQRSDMPLLDLCLSMLLCFAVPCFCFLLFACRLSIWQHGTK